MMITSNKHDDDGNDDHDDDDVDDRYDNDDDDDVDDNCAVPLIDPKVSRELQGDISRRVKGKLFFALISLL